MTLTTVTLLKGLVPVFLAALTLDLLMTTLAKRLRGRLQQFDLFTAVRRMTGTAVTRDKRPVLAVQAELLHDIFVT